MIPVKLIRKGVKRLYKKFYALINVSEKAHDYFKEPFLLPNTPSAIIPNALDSESFMQKELSPQDLASMRKQWGIQPDDIVLLFLGRVVEEKRVEELLEVCMRVINKDSKIKVLFVGAEPYRIWRKKAAKSQTESSSPAIYRGQKYTTITALQTSLSRHPSQKCTP